MQSHRIHAKVHVPNLLIFYPFKHVKRHTSSKMWYFEDWGTWLAWWLSGAIFARTSGPVFCPLLGLSSGYAQPFTGQVTEVTCHVIDRQQLEFTPAKREKMGPSLDPIKCAVKLLIQLWLVPVMAWHRPGERPLLEPTMNHFTDAYIHHRDLYSLSGRTS